MMFYADLDLEVLVQELDLSGCEEQAQDGAK
jgi:hypothetical protein